MMKKKNSLVSWDDHLDKKYGKEGMPTRLQFEEGYEAFKIKVLAKRKLDDESNISVQ